MFKRVGVLAMVLASALFATPVQATAADWHNGGDRVYGRGYAGDYRESNREFVRGGFDRRQFYGDRARFEGDRYGYGRFYREPRFERRREYYYAAPVAPYYSGAPYYGYGDGCR